MTTGIERWLKKYKDTMDGASVVILRDIALDELRQIENWALEPDAQMIEMEKSYTRCVELSGAILERIAKENSHA